MRFKDWLLEQQTNDLSMVQKHFQIDTLPQEVSIEAGRKLPDGTILNTTTEYKVEKAGGESEDTSLGEDEEPTIILTKIGKQDGEGFEHRKRVPYGNADENAPETIRMSFKEFGELWGDPFRAQAAQQQQQQQQQQAMGMAGGAGGAGAGGLTL